MGAFSFTEFISDHFFIKHSTIDNSDVDLVAYLFSNVRQHHKPYSELVSDKLVKPFTVYATSSRLGAATNYSNLF